MKVNTPHKTGSRPAWRSGTHTPARQVVAHTGSIVRGKFPSVKAGRMVAFESLLERDALYLFDFSESITDIHEQPFTLTFTDGARVRRYTPDFALTLEDGSPLVLEVKPANKLAQPELARTFALIRNEMRTTNQCFRILTDDAIRHEPRLGTLKLLHRYLSMPLPEPILRLLGSSTTKSSYWLCMTNIAYNPAHRWGPSTDRQRPSTGVRHSRFLPFLNPCRRALRRKHYLDELTSFGPPNWSPTVMSERIALIGKKLGDASPPSSTTLYRWYQRYNGGNRDARTLMQLIRRSGSYGCRSPIEVQEALEDLIQTRLLEGPGCSIRDLHDGLRARVDQLNRLRAPDDQLCLPSYNTVRRAVQTIPAYEKSLARNGKEYANNEFRTSLAAPKSKYILEQVEIDHTPLDLFVVDDNTWLPLGRPWLTLAIDHYSRMVLGFYLSFSPPSVESVFG